MSWIQILIDANLDDAESFEDALLNLGSLAVTLQDAADQPLYEPPIGSTPLWQRTRVIGLFETNTNIDLICAALHNQFTAFDDTLYRIEIVEDQAWERAWMANFKPIQCGARLWICPSWCDIPDKQAVNLMLDPGLAFGTGTHPTTHLCLQWLDGLYLKNKTLVDYGCGSGILAIAGLLLGTTHATAIDNDPQALIATRDNAERNHIDEKKLTVIYPREIPEKLQSDVLVANILAQPLIDLASNICALLKSGGDIALSGILEDQTQAVMQAYKPWIDWQAPTIKEGWVRLSGKKYNIVCNLQ
jgi:ribosomal protein L11 methyltransferase